MLVAQQTGDCIVRVDDAHTALRQPCVLLRGTGVPKPVEGQTSVRALIADLIPVAVDEQLQSIDSAVGRHTSGTSSL